MRLFVWLIASILVVSLVSCSDDSTGPCNCPDDGEKETRIIASIDNIWNTYFFFDRPPDETYPDRFFIPRPETVNVWRSIADFYTPETIVTWGAAWVDSLGDGSGIGVGDDFEFRRFKLLTYDDDFRFILDPATEEVIGLWLGTPLLDGEVLAVTYVNEEDDTIGDYDQSPSDDARAPLHLELIRPGGATPTDRFAYTWPYMIRNTYNLGIFNIDPRTLEIEIHEIANRDSTWRPEGSSIPWIQIFGLDQTDDTGTGPPDGKVDLGSDAIDLGRGLLTFPCLTPFDPPADLVEEWTNGEFAFTGPYEDLLNPTMYTSPRGSQAYYESSRFNIIFKFQKP